MVWSELPPKKGRGVRTEKGVACHGWKRRRNKRARKSIDYRTLLAVLNAGPSVALRT